MIFNWLEIFQEEKKNNYLIFKTFYEHHLTSPDFH